MGLKDMKYEITKIGRIVELDEKLVKAYLQTVEPPVLIEAPFVLHLKLQYGRFPSEEEMPDKELSEYCNRVLLQELEFAAELPRIQNFLNNGGREKLISASQNKQAIALAT